MLPILATAFANTLGAASSDRKDNFLGSFGSPARHTRNDMLGNNVSNADWVTVRPQGSQPEQKLDDARTTPRTAPLGMKVDPPVVPSPQQHADNIRRKESSVAKRVRFTGDTKFNDTEILIEDHQNERTYTDIDISKGDAQAIDKNKGTVATGNEIPFTVASPSSRFIERACKEGGAKEVAAEETRFKSPKHSNIMFEMVSILSEWVIKEEEVPSLSTLLSRNLPDDINGQGTALRYLILAHLSHNPEIFSLECEYGGYANPSEKLKDAEAIRNDNFDRAVVACLGDYNKQLIQVSKDESINARLIDSVLAKEVFGRNEKNQNIINFYESFFVEIDSYIQGHFYGEVNKAEPLLIYHQARILKKILKRRGRIDEHKTLIRLFKGVKMQLRKLDEIVVDGALKVVKFHLVHHCWSTFVHETLDTLYKIAYARGFPKNTLTMMLENLNQTPIDCTT